MCLKLKYIKINRFNIFIIFENFQSEQYLVNMNFREVILLKIHGNTWTRIKMLFTSDNKIFKKPSYSSYEERTFELAKTLGEKNYVKPFNVFKNWNLVRTLATNRYKLISDYIHLIEEEQFDEH